MVVGQRNAMGQLVGPGGAHRHGMRAGSFVYLGDGDGSRLAGQEWPFSGLNFGELLAPC